MKKHIFRNPISALSLTVVLLLTFSSCEKDDPITGPEIDLSEVGSSNSKEAIIGRDLHLEGTIRADGLVEKIEIHIHQEDGSYEISKIYTEGSYIGTRETTLHEHIDIPLDAPAGDYHLHLTVWDQQGKSASAESELRLKAADE